MGSEEIYVRTGLRIDPYFSLPKLLWFRDTMPEIYWRARYFLTPHDFIVHQLTGQFCTDWTQASRTMLFNISRFEWDADLAGAFGVDIGKLPPISAPGTVVGTIGRGAAHRLGVSQGLPVVLAGGDQQAAALGLGALRQGQIAVNSGTGSFITAPLAEPLWDPQRRVLLTTAASGKSWLLEAGVLTSGAVYRWMRDVLAGYSTGRAAEADSYDQLNRLASQSRVGANGLLVLPHFAGSAAPYWDPVARGIIFNLTLAHSTADVVRAVLEGIAIEVGKNLSIIEALLDATRAPTGKTAIREVRVGGGVARCDLFNRIQADVYGCRVIPAEIDESTSLGAAILAAVAMDIYPDVEAAYVGMHASNLVAGHEPDPNTHAAYQEISRVHDTVYRALALSDVYSLAGKLALKLSST
jgi:xylulokinase/glycerol kinase